MGRPTLQRNAENLTDKRNDNDRSSQFRRNDTGVWPNHPEIVVVAFSTVAIALLSNGELNRDFGSISSFLIFLIPIV
jgi:hypothetical protein